MEHFVPSQSKIGSEEPIFDSSPKGRAKEGAVLTYTAPNNSCFEQSENRPEGRFSYFVFIYCFGSSVTSTCWQVIFSSSPPMVCRMRLMKRIP